MEPLYYFYYYYIIFCSLLALYCTAKFGDESFYQCLRELFEFLKIVKRQMGVMMFIQNQQMHQNYPFNVMLSQTLLHISAYQRHHQGAHMIFTSYLYVGVHYMKNNRISREIAPISIVTLWIKIRVEARFFTHFQTGPGAHPASCSMDIGSFPGIKRPGRGADHPPSSSAEVKKE
jgi:hypothetical protein